MGQKGSKEASGRTEDGTMVESLFIEQESLGANEESDETGLELPPASTSVATRKGKARNKAAASSSSANLQKKKTEEQEGNNNPAPQRQNLFQEELEVDEDTDKASKKEKKRKSKKSSIKRKTPSRRRSARVAPTLPANTKPESDSEDSPPSSPPGKTKTKGAEASFNRNKDVCVEIDDETNEPSMESETESLNMKPVSDSGTPVKRAAIGSDSDISPTRGAAVVTIGPVEKSTPDKAARVGEPPEETIDEVYFSPMQLYNAMNDGQLSPYLFDPSYILIVDTRDEAFYHDNHIVTAVHVSALENPARSLGDLKDYTILLLYDASGVTYSLTDSPLSVLMDDLTTRKLDPSILTGGFDAFFKSYPFLCSDKAMPTSAQRQKLLLQYPSEILKGQLYLGKGEQATNSTIVSNLGLTHIVNITTEHPNAFPDSVEYLTIRRDDEPSSDLHSVILDIVKFTGDALLAGGRVLIHCNLGRSRSSTAVIAYLMATRRWTLKDAYFYVKERRPIIDPNRGFLQQLGKFEKEILGDTISDPDELWMG